ncbi:MAG: 50S ribosomal protein L3 [Candidatus Liptonbacteria bacterium]|nr:50S ribosomal protein L3 [Candidatus Liptonbacteria bacterium]
MTTVLVKKLKMSQIWKDKEVIPVTVLIAEPATQGNHDVSVFKEGELVKVSGISKGKGFQGTVKRHGFHGGPKTHGQKNRFRAPGSIGSTAPQRVFPGRKMAGHMGSVRVTVKNLEIVKVDKEKNILMVRGAVPGARGGLVQIQSAKSKTSKHED